MIIVKLPYYCHQSSPKWHTLESGMNHTTLDRYHSETQIPHFPNLCSGLIYSFYKKEIVSLTLGVL